MLFQKLNCVLNYFVIQFLMLLIPNIMGHKCIDVTIVNIFEKCASLSLSLSRSFSLLKYFHIFYLVPEDLFWYGLVPTTIWFYKSRNVQYMKSIQVIWICKCLHLRSTSAIANVYKYNLNMFIWFIIQNLKGRC